MKNSNLTNQALKKTQILKIKETPAGESSKRLLFYQKLLIESALLSAAASYLWGGAWWIQNGAQISNWSAELAAPALTVAPPLY